VTWWSVTEEAISNNFMAGLDTKLPKPWQLQEEEEEEEAFL
jgi:hypothetical protein